MGPLDYYRQFAGMSDEEVSAQLRERAEERRRRALARIDVLDLSRTTWHELPHPDVVNAVTYAARGALNVTPDPTAEELRRELGRRNGVEPERVAVGHGAAQLLASAARALLGPGDELLTPWPSYGLYPVMAQRAGARAVPLPDGHDAERLRAAITPATRAIALCNPNDPTGERLTNGALRTLLDALPEHVSLLLDEALADFVTAERDLSRAGGIGSLDLLDDHPRLLVFRTFSKIYGLAGLRVGYGIGPADVVEAVGKVRNAFDINQSAQDAALASLGNDEEIVRRRALTAEGRAQLAEACTGLGLTVAAPAVANFVYAEVGEDARPVFEALLREGVIVRPLGPFGAPGAIRVTVGTREENDLFAAGLERVLESAKTAL
jgi:histidinol-phosphate aminotransferase